jgi:hypothetical protein
MRITKRQLKQLIKEELATTLVKEGWYDTLADFDWGLGGGAKGGIQRKYPNSGIGEYEPTTLRSTMDAVSDWDLGLGGGVEGGLQRKYPDSGLGEYDPYTVGEFADDATAVATAPARWVADAAGNVYDTLANFDWSLGGGAGGAVERKKQELEGLREAKRRFLAAKRRGY